MTTLSLDGNISYIGTEFIKLLNTGSSHLATQEYVDNAVANGGGNGGGNVDLSNYYTQTETDGLLNNKLNVNNPQDIIGTLRIDSTNGNGKLIVNAVGAPNDEDFYVNGLSNLGGTLKAQVIQASSNIQTSQQIQSNTINTYSNSNLIIQRNAIPYITLDSQIIDDETVEKIILMKDVEFSGGLSLNTLSVDTLNTIGLNDMVFNVATLGEFLRFQVSDNTVRVPNTRSFLSQNIFTDLIQPLTFSTDVVLNGGNSTNDAYEEYVRLDASAEKVSISKETKFENNIKFNVGQNISWTNVFIREVQGASRPEFDLIINGSTSHLRLWVAGAIKQAITNTTIACKVNIDAEQGITVFTGKELKTNTINSHTNSNLVIQRSGSTAITLKAGNEVDFSGYVNINNISTENDTDMAIRRNDIEFIRLFKDGTTSAEAIFCYKQLRATEGFKTTSIDTESVNDNLEFQRNGSSYMIFNSDRININQPLHLANTLFIDTVNKLSLKPSLESGVNIFDIRNLHPVVDNPMIRFRVGDGAGETIVCEMTNNSVSFQRNLIVGTAYELQTNAIDTVNDNPLIFNRNDNEIMRFENYTDVNSGNETYPLINVEATARLSCNHLYITHILNRAGQFDNTFQGSNALGTARVEYMRWNYADQSLDFNAPIDNTNISIIGNIIDTTVSDERLKTNIQDVESNFTECVKNVKVKTFEYTDEKYKNNDKFGMIAQDLLHNLPKEFKNIVKETKSKKDEGEAYLSINYMKINLILWGALQEQIELVSKLESRLFEAEDEIKALKGKGKAKSKAKSEQLSRSESSLGRSPKP